MSLSVTLDFFHLAFFPKDVTQYLPLQIRVRILCYRNKVCNKKISFMSFYATFSKPKQMTVLGLQGTPDKLGPGRSAKLLAVETIGHLETSLASLLCEIGVGNFWRRGTGGGKKCVFKQSKQQVYNCVIKGEKKQVTGRGVIMLICINRSRTKNAFPFLIDL